MGSEVGLETSCQAIAQVDDSGADAQVVPAKPAEGGRSTAIQSQGMVWPCGSWWKALAMLAAQHFVYGKACAGGGQWSR